MDGDRETLGNNGKSTCPIAVTVEAINNIKQMPVGKKEYEKFLKLAPKYEFDDSDKKTSMWSNDIKYGKKYMK